MGASTGEERLQKILAHAGVGSRRACEELIVQGRVTIDGKVVKELGTKVDPAKEAVAVDGQKVHLERPVYFAVYKPKGYVSTNDDPSGRPRVLDLLPEIPQRVYTVGRLDEMSVGLMLLTNDGELANKLAHPRFGVEKLYRVSVAGSPSREVLTQLTDGIWLAEGKVRAKRVRAIGKRGDSTILELVLAEGKNREVRRMLAKLGHKVMTLTRVAVGPITVKGLTAGQFRPLTGREVDLLRRVAAGEPVPMPWMTDRKPRREPERPRRPEGPSASEGRAGPRHGPGNDNRPPVRPGEIRHPGPRPSERPAEGRQPGPRSRNPQGEGYRPGPRPQGPPPQGPYGDRRGPGDRAPRPPSGPRLYGEDGPRPAHRPSTPGPRPYNDRQSSPPGRPNDGRGSGPKPPRPQLGPAPGGRPVGDRRAGPSTPRRPGPPPVQEPPRRKVIGMESEPVSIPDDRPKPRMKRPAPAARKPAPRVALGARPKPKRRREGEGPSE